MGEPIKKPVNQTSPTKAVAKPGLAPVKPPLLLTAGRVAAATVQPVVNTVKPVVSAVASTSQAAAKAVVEHHNKVPSSKRWIWWLVVILIVAGVAVGAWYFLTRDKDTDLVVPGGDSQERPIIYRAANFPTGSVRVSNRQAILAVDNLNPIPSDIGVYSLWLARSGNDVDRQKLMDFTLDGEGDPVNLDGGALLPIPLPTDSISYDQWQVAIVNPQSGSATPAIILAGENSASQATNELSFPVGLKNVGAKLVIDGGNTRMTATLDPLPNLASFGQQYEAWAVKFTGPTVTKQTSLGKLQGSGGRKTISVEIPGTLADYDTFVISIEPLADIDPNISQIKPFSAEL